MRNYKSKKKPEPELEEIIKISNSKIEVFEDKKSFYTFGEPKELRNQLRGIAKLCAALDYEYAKGRKIIMGPGAYVPQTLFLSITEYKIEFAPSRVVRILSGVDARRLKICPGCDDVFFAKKINAETCGEKQCVEKEGGKTYYKKNKDEINKKKRIKYYNDNGIAYCPKCFFRAGDWCECNEPSGKRSNKNGTL